MGLLTWTEQTTPGDGAANGIVQDVAWSPSVGAFVTAGNFTPVSTKHIIMRSTDGVTWTDEGNPWGSNLANGYGVCWNEVLGLFVACVFNGSPVINYLATSPTGLSGSWTLQGFPNTGGGDQTIVRCDPATGKLCSIFTDGLAYSDDAVTWTNYGGGVSPWFGKGAAYGLCWSPDLALWCIPIWGTSGCGVLLSPDRITWTQHSTPYDNAVSQPYCVVWSSRLGKFFAGGSNDVSIGGLFPPLMSSPDGVTWTPIVTPFDSAGAVNSVDGIANINDDFLLAGCQDRDTGAFTAMTSIDGVTWVQETTPWDGAFPEAFYADWSPSLGLVVLGGINGAGDKCILTAPYVPPAYPQFHHVIKLS